MKHIAQLIILLIISKGMYAQTIEYNWDTITFENNDEYLVIDTSESNIWQVCIPNKVFFNSAYSPDKAIVTDSIGYYPKNNHSFFDVYIGQFNDSLFPLSVFVEFRHKFDTDALKDGGYISVSYDGGDTWMNIIHDNFGWLPPWQTQDLYSESDTLFNGEPGFSGRSSGWVTTVFWKHVMLVKNTNNVGDTMIIRFNFISDSTQSDKEGWMIDDIRLYSMDIGGGLENNEIFKSLNIYPDPVSTFMSIELDKECRTIDIEIIDPNGKLIQQNQYHDADNITLRCAGLNDGVYFIRTTLNSKEIYVNKVIIKK